MQALTPTVDSSEQTLDRALAAALLEARNELRSLSVVVPLLNEAESLPTLYQELTHELRSIGLPYEMIFVDDGSTDGSSRILRALHASDEHVEVVEFRRNFGKSAALQAGFSIARGDAVVTLDADLQDVPAEIPHLLAELERGADLVSGWKVDRQDPVGKRAPSAVFNSAVRLATGVKLHDFNCGLKAYRAEVLREVHLYGELHRYVPVLAHFRGFRVAEVPVSHRPRRFGTSKFGPGRFARGFFDLLTVLFLTQYTRRPLHLFGWFGLSTLSAGFVINAYLAAMWFMGNPIGQRPLLTLGVLLMIIGAQFVSFGLVGEMIASGSSQQEFSVRRYLDHRRPFGDSPDGDLVP
ncbi:MAG TPA: glycosyltransferase family 2 protein [Thermomicrobiaceae bacterium]|nr:glycosyltransferase family 2 protein [Thermomicrobiaceae bacterium]